MKRTISLLLAVLFGMLALAGCSGEDASSAPKEGFAEGTVVDFSGSEAMLVRSADGAEYLFNVQKARLEGAETIDEGDTVVVYYEGELAQGSASAQPVQVTRVVVKAQPEVAQQTVAGTVTDAAMNTLVITTGDGTAYTFGTEDVPVSASSGEGLLLGDVVEVTYKGELDKTATVQDVEVVGLTILSEAKPEPQPNPNPPEGYIGGTVTDASMNVLTLQTVYGVQYVFSTQDASVEAPHGLVVGDVVAVYYQGALSDGGPDLQPVSVESVKVVGEPPAAAPASSSAPAPAPVPAPDPGIELEPDPGIELEPEPEPSPDPGGIELEPLDSGPVVLSIDGSVDDASMNTLTLVTPSGVDYLFSTADALVYAGDSGLRLGDWVTVYYIGGLATGPDLQNVRVTEVMVHH